MFMGIQQLNISYLFKMWSYLLVLLFIVIEATANDSTSFPHGFQVQPILVGNVYNCCQEEPYASHRDIPVIYCFSKLSKGFLRIWMDVYVETELNPDHYELYEGVDSKEVWNQFIAQQSSWIGFNWQRKDIDLNPFNASCFGILTDKDYTLKVQVLDIKLDFLIMYSTAVLLFYYSHMLSQNKLFYYVSVFVFGMSASVLVLLYFILKMLPLKRSISMTFLAGWATVLGILLQAACKNLLLIFFNYRMYAFAYLSFSGVLSLILYYRFGPIEDYRTKKLVKYGLQLVGFLILFNSTHLVEAFEVTLIVLIIITNFSPLQSLLRWIICLKDFWLTLLNFLIWHLYEKRIVRPRKLLTELEYQQEAVKETECAVYKLREYCNGEVFAGNWQIVFSLKNPIRFGKFLTGDSHITNAEEREHHSAMIREEFDSLLTEESDIEN